MKNLIKQSIVKFLILVVGCGLSSPSFAKKDKPTGPKLVVGIVVDQMRWDYLYRYYDRYEAGGFKRLLKEGFNCENTYITHLPSVTAIGHATVYTGSVPAIHGITGNNWVDQLTKRAWYCAEDTLEQTVGSKSAAGRMSPRNLLASTITDELALATNFRSKIVGISLKDRGAIMPAGHTPTGAFWFDGKSGDFITSTYYMKDLPDWVKSFNAMKRGKELVKGGWNTLYPVESYVQSNPDNVSWEGLFPGQKDPVFPHDIKKYYDQSSEHIAKTPFGNTLILDFARAAIEGYDLANGPVTNFLGISCSSPDYVGHMYSANSVEAEDTFLRLDRDLAAFFKYLDKKIGKDNYTLFLTADHGGAHNPVFMKEHNLPGGANVIRNAVNSVNAFMKRQHGLENLVKGMGSSYVVLDDVQISRRKMDYEKLQKEVIELLRKEEGIQFVAEMATIGSASIPEIIKEKLINGYNSKRSGNIAVVAEPGWSASGLKGASHSMWSAYDTHIPLLFMGWGIKPGKSVETYSMCDIAPTLAALLRIQTPNGSIGKAITEVLE